jgi:superfamily II DNA or RNA helicase
MPTGAGKTIMAAHVVTGARGKAKRVAFTVPLLSLIDQTVRKMIENGIDPGDIGVLQGDHPMKRPQAPIQICSVQTLARRELPEVDVVVVDECHLGYKIVEDWMARDPKKVFIGLSATPWRKGMREQYDDLLQPTSLGALINQGMLCKYRAFAPSHPDLSGVKTIAGDYHEGQLSEVMQGTQLVADVVETWLAKGRGRPTLVFCVDRAHAQKLHEEFAHAGVRSAYVDALTDREERSDIVGMLERGELEVICSIGTMTTGSDIPCVSCISYARPTRSEMLFVQSIGRGLRTHPGKEDCIVLDHSDTTLRLGLVDTINHAELLSGEGGQKSKNANEDKPEPRPCPSCGTLIPVRVRTCPVCQTVMSVPSTIQNAKGELFEVATGEKVKRVPAREWSIDQKARFFGELIYYGQEKGYKSGWAANKYRERVGAWPNHPTIKFARPVPPSQLTRGWLNIQRSLYAKARMAADA